MDQVVLINYPDYVEKLNSYKYDVQRWAMIRYLIFYMFGGIYVNFDYECLYAQFDA